MSATKERHVIEVRVTVPVAVHYTASDIKNIAEDGETSADETFRISEELESEVTELLVDGLKRFDPTWYGDVKTPDYIDVVATSTWSKDSPKKVAKRKR